MRRRRTVPGLSTAYRPRRGATAPSKSATVATRCCGTARGPAKATSLVIPEVKGLIDGLAIRVPTPDVSFTDLVVEVEKTTTVAEVNTAFSQAAASGPLAGYLCYSEEELVSADYIGSAYSCILDAKSTNVIGGTLVKVCGWYDNEWGYSSRCVDLVRLVGSRLA